jgi:hypothetical protein
MRVDSFEDGLRAALAERAATVPADAIARLCRLEYRPRTRSRVTATGLAATVLAVVGAGAYARVAGGPSAITGPKHDSSAIDGGTTTSSVPRETIELAGYIFPLPAGARVGHDAADASCARKIPPIPGEPETVTEAGGVFTVVNGGCLRADLGPATVPAGAQPVTVGTWNGFIASDPTADQITLYVVFSTKGDVVFNATGTGMTASQLIAMAEAGLTPCSAQMDNAPTCASTP